MDEQGEHQEGWQANDLRSGVAKVFAEAKERNALAVRVLGAWSAAIAVHALLGFLGVLQLTPPVWDAGAALSGGMLASLAISRIPAPLLGSVALVIADLVALAFQFPLMIEQGTPVEHVAAVIRMIAAPVAIFFVLNGWMAAISIQAFKSGFSPGADWRTRINPRTMTLVIVLACFAALVLGVLFWMGAIRAGFWEKPGKDIEHPKGIGDLLREEIMKKPEPKEPEKPAVPAVIAYPDEARPVTSLEGLDEYARSEAEDAWYFAEESDEAGCVLEGHGRQDRCRDDRCRYWARFFVRACLPKSSKTQKFCSVVPKPTDGTGGEEWAAKLCAGRPLETCRELLFAVQGHCHPPEATDNAQAPSVAPPRRQAR